MKSHSRVAEAPLAESVRHATVAGMFYPQAPHALQKNVDALLDEAHPESSPENLVALLAPHAGYVYSGAVAAHAYKLLQGRAPRTVAVIAPSHFERFPFVALFSGRAYLTPLGGVPVAQNLVAELLHRDELFMASWQGHHETGARTEHALEVQLPFLQRVWPESALLPIVMGEQSWEMCEVLARHLAALAARHSLLLIASSDLSHYHDFGEARYLDKQCLQLLAAGDAKRLFAAFQKRDCEACGAGPIIATMLAAQQLGANQIKVLNYNHSGVVSGDRDCVVGYAAASFSRMV